MNFKDWGFRVCTFDGERWYLKSTSRSLEETEKIKEELDKLIGKIT